MQLTLLDTCQVKYEISGHNVSFKEVDVFSSDEANCRSDNDHVPKNLISELLGNLNCRLKIDLSHNALSAAWNHTLQVKCDPYSSFDTLKTLWERFEDKVKVSLFIKCLSSPKHVYAGSYIDPMSPFLWAEGMNINKETFVMSNVSSRRQKAPSYLYTCKAFGLDWRNGYHVERFTENAGNMRLIITANFPWDNEMSYMLPMRKQTTPRKILDTGLAYDVVITAGNGAEVKAHKNFLFAWSSTFQTIFQSGMMETHTGRLDMSDVSEPGIWAFLRYIYYEDLHGPKQDVGIAYEMLYVAHKYEVVDLERLVLKMLLAAPDRDFNANLAFKIYSFVRNIGFASLLKSKMIGVLKMKIDEVKTLPEYKELFTKNPEDAMELCELLAKAMLK